jgi:hypothetical protein
VANSEAPREDLRTVYDQLCASYHAIDDFRAKLLGFLPLASSGIFLLLNSGLDIDERFLRPIGFFGSFVTFGLVVHELIGIRKCRALINNGAKLEQALLLATAKAPDTDLKGQFGDRDNGFWDFNNRFFAAAIIYTTVLVAWLYVALASA